MEHLLNCHSEWLFALQALAMIPFVGLWARSRFSKSCSNEHGADQPRKQETT